MVSIRRSMTLAFMLVGFAASPVVAQDAKTWPNCHSIASGGLGLDSCARDGAIVWTRGAKAEVKTISNAQVTTPASEIIKHASPDASPASVNLYCPNGQCACEENSQYVEFKGKARGLRAINEAEANAAQSFRCGPNEGTVRRIPEFVETSGGVISTAIYEMRRGRASTGSCHGTTRLSSYSPSSGKMLTLADAVAPKSLPKLRESLLNQFIARHGAARDITAKQRELLMSDVVESTSNSAGVYVERGKVYVNVNSFFPNCAAGSFNPLVIPSHLIKASFRKYR